MGGPREVGLRGKLSTEDREDLDLKADGWKGLAHSMLDRLLAASIWSS